MKVNADFCVHTSEKSQDVSVIAQFLISLHCLLFESFQKVLKKYIIKKRLYVMFSKLQ